MGSKQDETMCYLEHVWFSLPSWRKDLTQASVLCSTLGWPPAIPQFGTIVRGPLHHIQIIKCIGPSTYKCGLSLVALTYIGTTACYAWQAGLLALQGCYLASDTHHHPFCSSFPELLFSQCVNATEMPIA